MKRIISILMVLILICSLLTGCNKAETVNVTDKEADTTKDLVFASAEWGGIDTAQLTSICNSHNFVADSLFYREIDGTLTPNIAKSYTVSPDGLTVTVELPDDLRFHDGTPVMQNDVKRSFEWVKEKSPFAGDFESVQSVEVNGNNVIFHLSAPSPTFLFSLGSIYMPVIKADDIDSKTPDEMLWGCTIYGAYYVDEYVSGSHVTLKKNSYYKTYNTHVENKGPTNIDTITVRFITDPFALVQGILSGEIAQVDGITPDQLSELSGNSDIAAEWIEAPNVIRLRLNNDYELFKDPEVRQAMMLLIDRAKICGYAEGLCSPAYAYCVSGMTDYNPAAEEYFKANHCDDAERALQILSDKGWKDSDGDGYLDRNGKKFEFTLSFANNILQNLAEILYIEFKSQGIQMNINNVDSAAMSALDKGDTYEAALNIFFWGDTAGTLPYLNKDNNMPDLDKYNKMVQEAIATVNREARIEGYTKAQQMLMDTGCNFPLIRVNTLLVYNKSLLANMKVRAADGSIMVNDVK